MRQYRGEWSTVYDMLKNWGEWHWISRDRPPAGLGFRKVSSFYLPGRQSASGMEFDMPPMTDEQLLIELIVRNACADDAQRLAKLLFCDRPTDSWVGLADRLNMPLQTFLKRRDALLGRVDGAVAGYRLVRPI